MEIQLAVGAASGAQDAGGEGGRCLGEPCWFTRERGAERDPSALCSPLMGGHRQREPNLPRCAGGGRETTGANGKLLLGQNNSP